PGGGRPRPPDVLAVIDPLRSGLMKRLAALCLMALALGAVAGCGSKQGNKIGFMPKLAGIPYFNACKRGAEEAAGELGIDLVYNGPTKADVDQQIDLLNQWTASGDFNCIAVACNDPDQVADGRQKDR